MFFILSKILSILFSPFAWILILLAIGLLTKRQKLKKWTLRSAGIAVFFFTNTVLFSEFVRHWEVEGTKIEDVGHYDVAVVLGGMAEFDNNHDRISLRRGGDRIWQALHLYHLGKVDKIMIVGANGAVFDRGLNEAEQFKDVLMDFGIPPEDLIIEENSKNTHENAVESKKVLDKHPEVENFLLVTSAMHMRRSKACFEQAGFENFDVFTTDHFTGAVRGYSFEQFIVPNISIMSDWSRFNHEWAGYIVYYFMGYV